MRSKVQEKIIMETNLSFMKNLIHTFKINNKDANLQENRLQ